MELVGGQIKLRDPVGHVEIGEMVAIPPLVGAVDLAEVPAFMCPLEPSVANTPNHHPASVPRTGISINPSPGPALIASEIDRLLESG